MSSAVQLNQELAGLDLVALAVGERHDQPSDLRGEFGPEANLDGTSSSIGDRLLHQAPFGQGGPHLDNVRREDREAKQDDKRDNGDHSEDPPNDSHDVEFYSSTRPELHCGSGILILDQSGLELRIHSAREEYR